MKAKTPRRRMFYNRAMPLALAVWLLAWPAQAKDTWTRREIAAPVPAGDADFSPLKLVHSQTFDTWDSGQILVSLHRGANRPDLLRLWLRVRGKDDRYRPLTQLVGEQGPDVSRFQDVDAFDWGEKPERDQYLHAALIYEGPGHVHRDFFFRVTLDHALETVEFEPAAEAYKFELKNAEEILEAEADSFQDDDLRFEFRVWRKGDKRNKPTGGTVSGTYKIVKENRRGAEVHRVVTGAVERKPIE